MITSKLQYEKTMRQIENLMLKGSNSVTAKEAKTIKLLAKAAQQFEQKIYKIKEQSSF